MLVHKHLIIRAKVKNPPMDPVWGEKWIKDLIEKIGMKLCAGPIAAYVDMPGNKGLTCAAIIETSHIAMHVWDEPDANGNCLLQLDVYTCGPFKPKIVLKELEQWEPVEFQAKYLDREHDIKELSLDDEED